MQILTIGILCEYRNKKTDCSIWYSIRCVEPHFDTIQPYNICEKRLLIGLHICQKPFLFAFVNDCQSLKCNFAPLNAFDSLFRAKKISSKVLPVLFTTQGVAISTAGLPRITKESILRYVVDAPVWSMNPKNVMHRPFRNQTRR